MTTLQYKPLDVFTNPEGSILTELLRYRTALETLKAGDFSEDTRNICIEGLAELVAFKQNKLWNHNFNRM